MSSILSSVKSIILNVCNLSARFKRASSGPAVLMYHSFDTTGWKYGVSPHDLGMQFSYLKKNYQIVSLQDIIAWVNGEKTLPDQVVAITVDDGYEDTYTVFWPLVQKHNFPFTLFLTTDLSPQPKLGNLPRPSLKQLEEIAHSPLCTVGLHGHTHKNFSEVFAENLVKEEIENSRQLLEEVFGKPVNVVAYPAGKYGEEVVNYFKSMGYSGGCTTRPGFICREEGGMALRRIGVDRSTSMSLFKGRLKAGFPYYLRFVRMFK